MDRAKIIEATRSRHVSTLNILRVNGFLKAGIGGLAGLFLFLSLSTAPRCAETDSMVLDAAQGVEANSVGHRDLYAATADDDSDRKCLKMKMDASRKLCDGIIKCYTNKGFNVDEDALTRCYIDPELKFRSKWEKAEAKALRSGKKCDTAEAEDIEAFIEGSLNLLYADIHAGISDKDGAGRFQRQLFKSIRKRVSKLFKNAPEGISPDFKLQKEWSSAIFWAGKNRVSYDESAGLSRAEVEERTFQLVLDIYDALYNYVPA